MSTPKQLDLRGLTEAERDAKVTHTVACTQFRYVDESEDVPDFTRDSGFKRIERHSYYLGDKHMFCRGWLPPYATSADAVLPLLEKTMTFKPSVYFDEGVWNVALTTTESHEWVEGEAPTFPLAACYALLRANGYEVLT